MNVASILLPICLFVATNTSGQEVKWRETKNWKLYYIPKKSGLRCPVDSLHFFKSIDLDSNQIKSFLQNASLWLPEKTSLWMGYFVVSYETSSNKINKVLVSRYGGFFYDDNTKRYYEVPEEIRNEWLDFFNSNQEKLLSAN